MATPRGEAAGSTYRWRGTGRGRRRGCGGDGAAQCCGVAALGDGGARGEEVGGGHGAGGHGKRRSGAAAPAADTGDRKSVV